jgi:hypothetical protein
MNRLVRVLAVTIMAATTLAWDGPNGALAASETVTVPFSLGETGVTTSNSYSGSISVTASGTGQAAGTQRSDAFYIFTDSAGNPVTPFRLPDGGFTLWINDGPAENYVNPIPAYRADHNYSFSIFAPGGRIKFSFGVGDLATGDNSGAYTVTISGGGQPSVPPALPFQEAIPCTEKLGTAAGVGVAELFAALASPECQEVPKGLIARFFVRLCQSSGDVLPPDVRDTICKR